MRGPMRGLLRAGDPHGQVAVAWKAKEAVRDPYGHQDQALALEWIDALVEDLTDKVRPPEARSDGHWCAGASRSPRDTLVTSPSDRPRRRTIGSGA
jgi:hypothetical protein